MSCSVTVGVSRSGVCQAETRASARTSRSFAAPSTGCEPWPPSPSATSVSQSARFSVVAMPFATMPPSASSGAEAPPSFHTSAGGPSAAQWRSISHSTPAAPAISSSALAQKTRSRRRGRSLAATSASAAANTAPWPLSSSAPRPHTAPSRISPPKGGAFHSAASAGTTSRCESSRTAPEPSGAVAGSRAITLPRPGADSTRSAEMPCAPR